VVLFVLLHVVHALPENEVTSLAEVELLQEEGMASRGGREDRSTRIINRIEAELPREGHLGETNGVDLSVFKKALNSTEAKKLAKSFKKSAKKSSHEKGTEEGSEKGRKEEGEGKGEKGFAASDI
jgi:hypothetical protein